MKNQDTLHERLGAMRRLQIPAPSLTSLAHSLDLDRLLLRRLVNDQLIVLRPEWRETVGEPSHYVVASHASEPVLAEAIEADRLRELRKARSILSL